MACKKPEQLSLKKLVEVFVDQDAVAFARVRPLLERLPQCCCQTQYLLPRLHVCMALRCPWLRSVALAQNAHDLSQCTK